MVQPDEFRIVFRARIRALRQARGLTQVQMAQALGIGAEAYRAYETRALLPHHLVERFAELTGIAIRDLFKTEYLRAAAKRPSASE